MTFEPLRYPPRILCIGEDPNQTKMVDLVIMEGYLHKQSKHLKLWKIRYFVLTESTLAYSKKSGKKAKNTYELKDVDVVSDQNYVVHDHNFVFEVKHGEKRMFLSAPTESERLKWVQGIKTTRSKLFATTDDGDTEGKHSEAESLGSFLGGVFRLTAPSKMQQRQKRQVTKERKEERKRAHLSKMKKSFSAVWLEDVLPSWGDSSAHPQDFVEALCFAGIPKEVRGRAWSAMLGNRLQINEQLFEICKTRAKAVLLEMTLAKDKEEKSRRSTDKRVSLPTSPRLAATATAEAHVAEQLIADNERNIKLVQRDMPRTFGNHPLFQTGAAGTQKTYEVLEAYTCYRPDLGYVQGMSYLAAILCLHLDSFGAFRAMVSLMSTRLLFDMYRLEEERTFRYLTVYDSILKHELPQLYDHFQEIGMDPKMYVVDWAFTLFTRCVPLEVVLRIWDCYILIGTPFFFQACMAILIMYEDALLTMDLGDAMKFLHNVPKTCSAHDFFEAMETVNLSRPAINELLSGGDVRPWSPVGRRPVEVEYPEAYEY
ncbi:Aste57867_20264 [Aphanomyces stellatus]|uniref:Aste57867_20264 protein n=1 Tax=Aphanomyces stellatus TaxID=120398 RepID=A0A485LJA4_9STRA|nr:hypothetical protein As57867_020198 [Aphanomyces stellatus]VFT96954.1 Aste57867_20264 [Aphanomyces stellatus]